MSEPTDPIVEEDTEGHTFRGAAVPEEPEDDTDGHMRERSVEGDDTDGHMSRA